MRHIGAGKKSWNTYRSRFRPFALSSLILLSGALFFGTAAHAAEITTYEYDAQGRLIKSAKSGGPASGTGKCTSYDAAGNRTNQTVNGAGCTAGSSGGGGGGSTPSFAINNASAIEGGTLTFTITKSGSASATHSVSYGTANSSAFAGSDYNAASGTLTFTAAQTSKTVTVSTINDSVSESTEIFHLNLSSPTGGATISDSQGNGTITDNDSGGQPPSCPPECN